MTEGKAVVGGDRRCGVLTAALYFTIFRGMRDENSTAQKALDTKVAGTLT